MSVRLSGSRLAAGVGHHPIAATALAATAPRMTTSQGGTPHITSMRKAMIPIAKSAGAWMALIQTGL